MKMLSRLLTAMIFALGFTTTASLGADQHGHITYRDHDGNCMEDDDDDNDCDTDCDDEDAHYWEHEHEHGFLDDEDDEDIAHELDEDAGYPSQREPFSEQFR